MVGSTFVAAISIAALPLLTSQAPQGSVGLSAWPHNEGRLFDVPSKEAWDRVQAGPSPRSSSLPASTSGP